jgi:hypothetical protein
MSVVDAVKRPTAVSSAGSILAAAVVVGLLLPARTARVALAVELVGIAVFAGGVSLSRRSYRLSGVVVAVLGSVTALGAAAFALSLIRGLAGLIVTVPGVVGVPLLALALVPVYGSGSRTLVKAGTGAVFVAVLAAGLFRYVSLQTLLVAGVGTIVAWDLAERAINVGEQLGRVAETRRLEAVHGVGSGLVGSVAVGSGVVVAGVGSSGLPLSALAALLVAVLLLTAALHG